MIIAGVTGGIGSGKSTLCRVWEELGARVVYADDLAKHLMVHDKEVKRKLIKYFGDKTYNEDGSLNKAHLIQEAFENGRVDELNQIVHPAVAQTFKKICVDAKTAGEKLVVKEAALLLNEGRPPGLDVVVLVTSPKNEQVNRVRIRDGMKEEEVEARIKKQPDFDNLKNLVDYTVVNDGSLEEFIDKAKDLYKEITDIKA
jgi:dephospho-CoA kinase